jgi:large subunit ribosomal protein L3
MTEPIASAVAEKPAAPAATIKAILAQKVGMSRIYDAHGKAVTVTILQAGPCAVTQVLSPEKQGYSAIQVCFGEVREKSVNKPEAGIFKKANVPAAKWIREFRTDKAAGFQVGQTLKADVFTAGDYVDVFGTSKGKGFAGAMKRHNFGGGPSTHGQSDRARATGSSGSNTYPGRVFKGKKFPGHLGVERVTVQHLEVVQVDPAKDLMLIKGAVPGPIEGLVTVRGTVKKLKAKVVHAPESGKKDKKKETAKSAAPAAAAKAKGGK